MPWLLLFLFLIGLGIIIWLTLDFCDKTPGTVCFCIALVILVGFIAGIITSLCSFFAAQNPDNRIFNEPTQIIEISEAYILDEKIIILTTDDKTISYRYYDDYIYVSHDKNARIEIYEDDIWKSSIRQFLYGTPLTYYKIYRPPN